MGKWYRLAAGFLTLAVLIGGIRACQLANQRDRDLLGNTEGINPEEVGLTLRDVTLEQPDDQGELLWRVKAKEVSYNPDRQIAQVTEPDGELFQDGKVIYRVKADSGEIRNNGQVIFLRGNIVATGIENKAVLRGNELEWQPENDVLIVRDRITGTHPQFRAAAQEARVFNREKRMELEGNVVAHTVVPNPQQDPWLKLQANKLVWFWAEERIETDQPLKVEQFKANRVTDAIAGQQGTLDLAEKIVTLNQEVVMQLLEFPLTVSSRRAIWDVDAQTVQVPEPLRLVHPKEKVVVTANQGRLELDPQMVYLTDNVQAQSERNQARLRAQRLTWNVAAQTLVAEGAVNYQQVNPAVQLTGPKATGALKDQTLVVSGGRVVTQIVPEATLDPKLP